MRLMAIVGILIDEYFQTHTQNIILSKIKRNYSVVLKPRYLGI